MKWAHGNYVGASQGCSVSASEVHRPGGILAFPLGWCLKLIEFSKVWTEVNNICGPEILQWIQAYLVLLHFPDIAFFFFNRLKVCGNPQLIKSVLFFQEHLLISCVPVTSWQLWQYFKVFHYWICSGPLWLVVFDVTVLTGLKLRWWLAFFSNKI